MNKQEKMIVAALVAGLMAWLFVIGPKLQPKNPPGKATTNDVNSVTSSQTLGNTNAIAAPGSNVVSQAQDHTAPDLPATTVENVVAEPVAPLEAPSDKQEQIAVISNKVIQLSLTSKGGAIRSAELSNYNQSRAEDSEPLVMSFNDNVPFMLQGMPGLGISADYTIDVSDDQRSAVLRAGVDGKYAIERVFVLGDGYAVSVTDRFVNATSEPLALSEWQLKAGRMSCVETNLSDSEHLSLDSYGLNDKGKPDVKRWKGAIPPMFNAMRAGCRKMGVPRDAPLYASVMEPAASHWVAPKSKFFTLLLRPEEPPEKMQVEAWRKERVDGGLFLTGIGASLVYPGIVLPADGSLQRSYLFYAGPKSFSDLKQLGHGEQAVMEWGIFKPICRILMPVLIAIHSVVRNWGVAIILLTFLVRGIFWPVTHKSTESMKRMQELQPKVKELQAKYKGEPQKLQQEQMKLYREHKVNPMASCLPMLIQIPVFIALFTVLRSSVDMRHSWFLWIQDLSEPENIPFFGYSLNILPVVMAGTMAWQQALTPSGDAQQKKMMMLMMPGMMLFMLYKMPSALMLYWSTSQAVSIVQLYWQRRRQHQKDAVAKSAIVEAPRETRQMRRLKEKQKSGS